MTDGLAWPDPADDIFISLFFSSLVIRRPAVRDRLEPLYAREYSSFVNTVLQPTSTVTVGPEENLQLIVIIKIENRQVTTTVTKIAYRRLQ
jgi:hypothetical protein